MNAGKLSYSELETKTQLKRNLYILYIFLNLP